MRRLLLILGVLLGSVMAQTTGPPLNLNIPPHGSFPWDTQPNGGVNANWTAINVFAAGAISVPGVTVGSELVSNGVSQAPVYQSKPSFDLRDYLKCDNAVTDDTAALSSLLTTIGTASDAKIIFPRTKCLIGTITIPTNVVADFTVGAGVFVKTGSIITWLGKIQASAEQIFFNATTGLGGIDFTGDFSLDPIFPEWWGAYPSATAAVNTPAWQSAVYGAFGCATSPATACRANTSGLTQYNRVIQSSGLYNINDEIKLYHVIGFRIVGQGKLKSGLIQTATNKRIFDGQSVAYGTFENMVFQSNVSQDAAHPLVDLGYSAAQGVDIRPQFITFLDDVFVGSSLTQIGVLIAKEGGGAQGSNIGFYNTSAQGFLTAAAQIGQVGTLAQNALTDLWIGGDIQGDPQFGLASYGGQWIVQNMSMENGLLTQTGYDVYCYAPQEVCDIEHVRSESLKLAAGDRIRVVDSTTTFQATQWDSGTGLAGTSGTTNQLVSGSTTAGDGAYYKVTVPGTWGGLNLTNATAGSATSITCGTCNFTVNGFTGNLVAIEGGTGISEYGVVTSNTATVITVSAGWKTKFSPSQVTINNPDATSQFIVEPNWGTQTTSGTVTFAAVNFNVISGNLAGGNGADTTASNATLQNVIAVGGKINAFGNFKDVGVTRTDWDNAANSLPLDHVINQYSYDNIQARLPAGAGTLWRDGTLMVWAFPRNTVTGYSNVSQRNMGSFPFVWSCATSEGGSSCPDVFIGGRAHPSTVANQAILEFGGILGAPTPNGANIAGANTNITGGLSTGTGAPGVLTFWGSLAGGAGSTVNTPFPLANITPDASGNGCIGLLGSTSGTATLCAPATAGVTTNALKSSNIISFPAGSVTSPSVSILNGGQVYGLYSAGTGEVDIAVNGTKAMSADNTGIYTAKLCSITTGVDCLTFASGLISTSGTGNPTLKATNGFQIGNGVTATLGTGLLTTGTCAAAVTVAWTNAATTSVVVWDYASDPSGVVGYGSSGGLTVTAYATVGNANFRVCNPTAGSITPGAMSLNFRVIF